MRDLRFRRLGAVLLALVLAGCWQQAGGGPENTRFNAIESDLTRDNVTSLAERWRTPVDGFVTEPIESGDRIYVATRKNQADAQFIAELSVQAYDRSTGALVWQRSLVSADGAEVTGGVDSPALVDGALWVPYWQDGLGPCAGRLVRLDPDTGAVLSSDATGTGPSGVVITGDRVAYTQGCDDPSVGGVQLVVRDTATRAVLWTYHFPRGAGVTTPTIAGGRIYLATGHNLYSFALDGCGAATCNPRWTRTGVTDLDFLRITAGPDGSLVTVGDSPEPELAPTIVVRDGATGDVRWQAGPRYGGQLPGEITGWAVAYGTVYVAGMPIDSSSTSPEAILDAYPLAGCGQAVCSPAWTADLGATRPVREPTVAGGVVYVPVAPNNPVASAMVAADAHGCGAPSCTEITRVPFASGGAGVFAGAESYAASVGAGRLVVAWLPPDIGGTAPTDLISFGPAGD